MATSKFEILRKNPARNASAKFTAPNSMDPVPRGFALGAHATDPEQFSVAQHNTFMGFMTRQMRLTGMTLSDRVFGVTSDVPVGVESPFTSGQEVTAEGAVEIEAEGSDYLWLSGTGLLDTNTAVGAKLSYKDGYLRVSQAGEQVNALLTANNLTPVDAGVLRIRAVMTT